MRKKQVRQVGNLREYLVVPTKDFSDGTPPDVRRRRMQRMRASMIRWIRQQDLEREIPTVMPATAFTAIFVQSTARGARQLRSAPGVKDVARSATMELIA